MRLFMYDLAGRVVDYRNGVTAVMVSVSDNATSAIASLAHPRNGIWHEARVHVIASLLQHYIARHECASLCMT